MNLVRKERVVPGRTYAGRPRAERVELRRVVAVGPEHRRPGEVDAVGVLFVSSHTGMQGRLGLSCFMRWARALLPP